MKCQAHTPACAPLSSTVRPHAPAQPQDPASSRSRHATLLAVSARHHGIPHSCRVCAGDLSQPESSLNTFLCGSAPSYVSIPALLRTIFILGGCRALLVFWVYPHNHCEGRIVFFARLEPMRTLLQVSQGTRPNK